LVESDARQADIQRLLIDFQSTRLKTPYPAAAKLRTIIYLLCETLAIPIDHSALARELGIINQLWRSYATTPFRDAAPKNMLVAANDLYLGNYNSESERHSYIVNTLQAEAEPPWVNARVVDFDFSSCCELTTPEDDLISIRYHERTWECAPTRETELTWDGSRDPIRAALTFLVRYYRFGGRKAAYRLLHPTGHRSRFRYDSDSFYFQKLPSILDELWPEARRQIPEVLRLTEMLIRHLGTGRPEIDYFMAERLGEKRTYFGDVFPY
jgi:hypothetical protein